ncbi:hypothetical protein LTR08_005297 [Meristemomyces frigidus]|nr:hypothetical protein LTR08_005297 [Meristemomyces frigidus]
MQCLCSPTRREVDKAHAKGDWMDIGVASVRNIYKINWRRSLLWGLLALSSVPIHLLYNSAIFKTLDANDYNAWVVNADFLQGGEFARYVGSDMLQPGHTMTQENLGLLQKAQHLFTNGTASNAAHIQKLSNNDCIAAYTTSFVSGRTDVLAITSTPGNQTNNTAFYGWSSSTDLDGGVGLPYVWICSDLAYPENYECDIATARKNAAIWTLDHKRIDYCLSQAVPSNCKLQFSVYILVTVILMNACKSLAMFLTLYNEKEPTLVTIGDAMASYLETPDELTKGRCLMAKVDVDRGPMRWNIRSARGTPRFLGIKLLGRSFGTVVSGLDQNVPNTQPLPVTYYAPLRRRWFASASIKRWCVTGGLIVGCLITTIALLIVAVSSLKDELSGQQTPFSIGFGAVDSRALLDIGLPQGGSSGLVAAVLLANLPQAIVSFLYLTYNGLLTCMFLCHEYSKYAVDGRRKPLRVTTPHGQQRSSYHLQLPFLYSIPLLITSGTLHWLISQSIFLARISVHSNGQTTDVAYSNGQTTDVDDFSEVGFSCLPILLRRAKLHSERQADPAVLVDIPETPQAEELQKSGAMDEAQT